MSHQHNDDTAERPSVSVIIPTRNEASTIPRVIAVLLAGTEALDIELIVSDGRSTDSTREVVAGIAANDSRVRLVDNPAHVTPEGLNAAIQASRGDFIVRMDGHADPEAGYVATCLRVLESTGAWNVGGRMRKVGYSRAARAASAATTSPFGIGGGDRFHLVTEPKDVDSVWLGCWPRWVFERVGLFDPELIQDQDEELNQRILDAGGRIRFDPAISAGYLSRATWAGLWRQYFRYGLFKVRAIQKRPTLLRPRHLVPSLLVLTVTAGLALAVVNPVSLALVTGAVLAWCGVAATFASRVAPHNQTSVFDVILAYACLHTGYGVGMLVGFVRFAPRWMIDRRGTIPVLNTRRTA